MKKYQELIEKYKPIEQKESYKLLIKFLKPMDLLNFCDLKMQGGKFGFRKKKNLKIMINAEKIKRIKKEYQESLKMPTLRENIERASKLPSIEKK